MNPTNKIVNILQDTVLRNSEKMEALVKLDNEFNQGPGSNEDKEKTTKKIHKLINALKTNNSGSFSGYEAMIKNFPEIHQDFKDNIIKELNK